MAETWTPLILSAACTPNPATAGATTVLSVLVVDAQGGARNEDWYSGELRAGEV